MRANLALPDRLSQLKAALTETLVSTGWAKEGCNMVALAPTTAAEGGLILGFAAAWEAALMGCIGAALNIKRILEERF